MGCQCVEPFRAYGLFYLSTIRFQKVLGEVGSRQLYVPGFARGIEVVLARLESETFFDTFEALEDIRDGLECR
jgi:hypothetical protein